MQTSEKDPQSHLAQVKEETRGMTLRELVLEMRVDMRNLTNSFQAHKLAPHPGAVGRGELYGVVFTIGGLVIAALRLF